MHVEVAVLLKEAVVLVDGGGVGDEGIGLGDAASLELGVRLGGAGSDLAEILDGDIQDLLALHAAVDMGEGHLTRGHGVFQLAVEDLPKVEHQTQQGQGQDGQGVELDGQAGDKKADDDGQKTDAAQNLAQLAFALGLFVHDEFEGFVHSDSFSLADTFSTIIPHLSADCKG